MNMVTLLRPDLRGDFPGIGNWHYLDSAATAQKPQCVIDATVRAMGADYATVHRGVYARSANMTLAYEAARRKVANFIGGKEDEIVFTKGATEAINLVAQSWGAANLKTGDRILLNLNPPLKQQVVAAPPHNGIVAVLNQLANRSVHAAVQGRPHDFNHAGNIHSKRDLASPHAAHLGISRSFPTDTPQRSRFLRRAELYPHDEDAANLNEAACRGGWQRR